MADDHSQRPFRNADLKSRAAPTASNPPAGNNDPLAELARLIGQSDPFGEFGREGARQPAAPPPSVGETEPMLRALAAQIPARDLFPEERRPAAARAEELPAGDFTRQPYGSAPLTGDGDLYQTQGPVPGYGEHDADAYGGAAYDPNMPPYAGEAPDYYDDIPPPRRRMGVLAIAAVFALAVIGTAGAFGYRALFGSSSSGPPPVIKADTTPSKIVPDKEKDQSAKLINDRVNSGGDQKLVSREERPVEINRDKPAGVLTENPSMAGGGMQIPAIGSGVIGTDPKKINTITIRPDQAGMTAAAPPAAPQAGAMPARSAPEPAPIVEREVATPPTAPAPARTAPERPASPPRQVAAAPSNAPLSLTPDAVSAPPRTAPAPARTASAPTQLAPPAAASSASGGFAVQVSSRRSEADAQAALQRILARYTNVLGGQPIMIRRVDLGAKGVYYRAMLGPFGNSEEAGNLCSQLKAAGGSCFVQRN